MATEHLVSLGHRRIACISGPENAFVARERLAGFMDVMAPRLAEAGLDPASWIVSAPFNYEGGREAAMAFVDGRIENVMAFEKWKAGLKPSELLRDVAGALGRMRYG